MSRESDWHVFDKAVEITAAAVRGGAGAVSPSQIADVFREVHTALRETADAMPSSERKAGF